MSTPEGFREASEADGRKLRVNDAAKDPRVRLMAWEILSGLQVGSLTQEELAEKMATEYGIDRDDVDAACTASAGEYLKELAANGAA